MIRSVPFVVVVASVLSACARLSPEQQVISDAATALGGRDRIQAVKTLLIEGEGLQYNLGQDVAPDASGQTYTVTRYRRAIDVGGARARLELTRKPEFPYFQGMAPQTQVQGLDGVVGYNLAANGTANRMADTATADRRAEWTLHPLLAVRAALDPKAVLANVRVEGGESLVDVTTADGAQFTLAIDATTKLPLRVATKVYDTNLGDVLLSTAFATYQPTGGLKLPTQLSARSDSFVTSRINITNQTVDAEVGDLSAPTAVVSTPAVTTPPPQNVTATALAKGITLLAGGSHHSVLVEFADHLLLIEAPLNGARAAAVIAKARELVPGKPLTQLVNTHHHFDHSGGVRAAVAEGLSVITHQGNVAFIEDVVRRPHTLRPDALSKSDRKLSIEGVTEQKTIADGTMSMTLYTLSGPHSQTMLYAYFPKERLLVEADVFTPNSAVNLFASAFLEELRKRNLRIERIAPLHGTVAPFAELLKVAGTRS